MTMSMSATGRFLRGAAAAAAVTVSLGAATLATVEPAQAYGYHEGFHRHFGGFHHGFAPFHHGFHRYGYGFRHPGFGYRPFVHPYGHRPFHLIRAPFYGYGYAWHHRMHRVWGPYGWHHHRAC